VFIKYHKQNVLSLVRELVNMSSVLKSPPNLSSFSFFSSFLWQHTEEILANDFTPTTCYSPQARSRVQMDRTELSQYCYSKRESWSSTDNSVEVLQRQHGPSAASTAHSSREILSLADVRAPLEESNPSARPSFVHSRAISNLTAQAREMAGGKPDYV